MYVKNIYNNDSNDIHKAWLVVFTCALSYGICLLFLPDCTSENFIKVLRQFISNRGSSQVIISDNGKYFTNEDGHNFVNV